MACDRITAGDHRRVRGRASDQGGARSVQPGRLHAHVRFNTSRTHRWQTDPARCHVNWVVLDSDWEAEFCRVAESHPRVRAYVKNHNLGLEVPYRYGSEARRTAPTSSCWWTTATATTTTCCTSSSRSRATGARTPRRRSPRWTPTGCPASTTSARYGRWAFAEFTEVYQIESDFQGQGRERVRQDDSADRVGAAMANGGTMAKPMAEKAKKEEQAARRSRDPQARRGDAEEHPDRRVPVGAGEGGAGPGARRLRAAATATSTRSSSGAARTSRTGATSSSTRRRSTSRRRSTPKALIDDLLRQTREEREHEAGEITPDLFADFNGIPKGVDKTEFYQHDQNWSNRMILGDSLAGDGEPGRARGPARQGAVHLLRPALRHQVQQQLPVEHDEPRREGRQRGPHHARAGAGEGVSATRGATAFTATSPTCAIG